MNRMKIKSSQVCQYSRNMNVVFRLVRNIKKADRHFEDATIVDILLFSILMKNKSCKRI